MKFLKPIIGCLLIVTSFAGLIYWENDGRERFTMEELAVATQDIEMGEVITRDMFKAQRFGEESVIAGALSMDEIDAVVGKVADRPIEKRSQVSKKFFDDASSIIEKGKSIYVLKPSWIDMRSSSLRAGDTVRIYNDSGEHYFGTYKIAFVKDDNEQEVVEAEGFNYSKNILDRKMSSRPANHVEIVATLAEYQAIMSYVNTEGRGIMLVQEGAV